MNETLTVFMISEIERLREEGRDIAFTGTNWTDAGILPEESRTLVQ